MPTSSPLAEKRGLWADFRAFSREPYSCLPAPLAQVERSKVGRVGRVFCLQVGGRRVSDGLGRLHAHDAARGAYRASIIRSGAGLAWMMMAASMTGNRGR